MDDNKVGTDPEGRELPDIDFKKKEEDISSTLQFKVVDAINKAKQNKAEAANDAKDGSKGSEHFVINVSDEKNADRVKSVDLLDGSAKKAGEPVKHREGSGKGGQPQHGGSRPSSQGGRPKSSSSNGGSGSGGSASGGTRSGSGSKAETAAKAKKKKWTKKKKALAVGGIVAVFVFAIFLIAYSFFHKWHGMLKTDDGKIDSNYVVKRDTESSNTVDPALEEERIKEELRKNAASIMSEDGVQNILLIGEDIRDTALEERGNTDVMLLISLDENRKKITMTSFLRDTYTYIPGWNSSKLNAAYGYGGVELLAATLQQDYAINIDRYVIVNFYSFIDIVEAVGGLDLDVSYTEAVAMRAPLNEQNNYLKNKKKKGYVDLEQYGKDGYDLYEGMNGLATTISYGSEEDNEIRLHLNGNQALAYARIRYGCGDDYGRTKRQREVMVEMIKEAKSLSFTELDALAEKVAKQVRTDITENEVAGLILGAFTYMSYEINQLQVPADGTFSNQIINGLDCLSVDFTANAQILQEALYGKTNIDADPASAGPYADNDGDGINDYFVDNDYDGIDDNLLDLDGDGIDDRAWNGGNTDTWG